MNDDKDTGLDSNDNAKSTPAGNVRKNNFYDRIPLNYKQVDIILKVAIGLLLLVCVVILIKF